MGNFQSVDSEHENDYEFQNHTFVCVISKIILKKASKTTVNCGVQTLNY